MPAALAADWLDSAWDQNAGLYATSPAAAVVEEVAAGWLLDLLGLPRRAGVGFVTGAPDGELHGPRRRPPRACSTRAGWDVEEEGLHGAPPVEVVVGEEAHVTILSALRMLGLGSRRARRVAVDGQGRMTADDLRARARGLLDGPTLVCAQAGNVNTGAFDPSDEIADLARERGAWLHVDGAFGLWAASEPEASRTTSAGVGRADSWATDAHKWLNVPYDCGIAIVARPRRAPGGPHRPRGVSRADRRGGARPASTGSPSSRAAPAASRSTPRCAASGATASPRSSSAAAGWPGAWPNGCARGAAEVRILNEVVLNQVLVRFEPPAGGDADAFTRAVIARVQSGGTCWLGGTRWRDQEVMRISVSNWSTTEADVDQLGRRHPRGCGRSAARKPAQPGKEMTHEHDGGPCG